MSASDLEGYSLRLADKHGQPRSLLAASLEKASSILASSPSGKICTRYTRELLLELRSKKECNICPTEVPALLNKNTPSSGVTSREDEGILIQRGPRNTPVKGADGEGPSPQENGPASWHGDREAWRHVGRPRSFEDEGGRGGPRERERWDRGVEKDMGPGGPRGLGARNHSENHRPMNPPGFGGARWGENRAGPGGRFRPEDREGYNGPGRFRDEGGRGSGPGPHGPAGPHRPLWDHPSGRERGPPGAAGPARTGPGFDRRGPPDDRRGPPGRPSGGHQWDEEYKDDETFGFDDPKQQSGAEKEEEEKKRRAQFEKEFEEMRKARHKKPDASENDTPSKKHDEEGIWDTNLSFEQSATTTTVTTGGQVNRRIVTTTMTGLRAPPGFGGAGARKVDDAGPVTPRTPRASDGDWRINKRTLIEETVEPSKTVTPSKAERDGGVQKGESKSEGAVAQAPGGASLLDTLFAVGDKGVVDAKDEGEAVKTKESLVLNNLFKNAHKKVFPGLGDDDPITEAVLSDRWADAVDAEEADAKASKFARWFNKNDDAPPAASSSAAAEKEERSLASSALMSMLQKPAPTATKSDEAPPPSEPSARNPLDLLFPSSVGSGGAKAMPAGPSLAEIEQAMRSEAGRGKEADKSGSTAEKESVNSFAKSKPELPRVNTKGGAVAEPKAVKSPDLKPKGMKSSESGGVAVKGLRDLVAQEKQNSKNEKKERGGGQRGPLDDLLGSLSGKHTQEKNTDNDQGPSQHGKALFGGEQKHAAPSGGDMLASIFGAGPGAKPAGASAKKADAPVFMTLEDIEKSMLEEADKGSGRGPAKPAAAQAAPKPSGKADVVASMHLLSLLKKGPQSAATGSGTEETGHGVAERNGTAGLLTGNAKSGSSNRPLSEDEGAWTFPEMHGPSVREATAFKGAGHGEDGKEVEIKGGLGEAREERAEAVGLREPDVLKVLGEDDTAEPGLLGDLLMRRQLADRDGSGSRFLKLESQIDAAPTHTNNHRLPALGRPEGGGWAGGPPDPFYGAPRAQPQLPPQMVPPQVLHQHPHAQLPPHLAGLLPYGANGGPFGPGPPSGPFYGNDRSPFGNGERQGQPLVEHSSGSSNGPQPGGPFGQPQEHPGSIPNLPPPYAFNLRGLMPLAGPQGMPPQFAHLNGPLPGGYMRPVFNLPYAPDGLHAGGPPHSVFGPASQSGRSGEQQMAHRPPPAQFLGGSPYGADFWGGTQPGGLGSGEGLPSAAR